MIKLKPKDKRKPRTVRLSDEEVSRAKKVAKLQLAVFYREAIMEKVEREAKK